MTEGGARGGLVPALQALLVTFLWSTSWVLIKLGLQDLPALTFAGLRYFLAFLVLAAWWWWRAPRPAGPRLTRAGVLRLAGLGLVMYTATQGAQFLALDLLPASTTSLVLSFTPAVVALAGGLLLREPTSPGQWAGIGVMVLGAGLFLWPVEAAALAGLAVAAFGTASNAGAALLGRAVNRDPSARPLTVTLVSMGVGSVVLLGLGLGTEGIPSVGVRGWAIIAWLAVVNTAFAFTLWNHTLRRLSAAESAVINNTMLIQIAVLAWIFLGERLDARQVTGLVLAAAGAVLVQLRRTPRPDRVSRRSTPSGAQG